MSESPASDQVVSAERALLGTLFCNPDLLAGAGDLITPAAFSYLAHGKILAALSAVHDRGEIPDGITLAAELAARGEIEAVGGHDTLAALYEWAGTPANLPAYARTVRQAHAARERQRIGFDLMSGAGDDPRAARANLERLDAIEAAAQGEDSPAKKWASLAMSGQNLAAAAFPETPSWLGDGILPAGELAFLTGHSGVGKTFLAVQLISALSVGHTFCGIPTRACRVGLLELEMPWGSVQRRVKSLHTIELDATAFLCSPPGAVHVTDPAVRANLAEFIKLHRLDVLMVDPFNRLHDLDENSGSDMGHVLEGLHDLRQSTGVAIFVLHHVRKMPPGPAGQPSRAASLDSGRGSSRLTNDPSTVMVLDESKGLVRLTFAKVRHSEAPPTIYLRRNDVGFFDVVDDPTAAKMKRADALLEMLTKSGSDGLSSKLAADILKVTERTVRRDLQDLGATVRVVGKNERVWTMMERQDNALDL